MNQPVLRAPGPKSPIKRRGSACSASDIASQPSIADTAACGVAAQSDNPCVSGELRIAPAEPDAPVLWERLHVRGVGQTPPLGTSRVRPTSDWIAQLRSCS